MDEYKPTPEEQTKIDSVRFYALNWAAKDIRKAAHLLPDYKTYLDQDKIKAIYPDYDGGSMVGAIILAFSVIHYTANFYLPKSQTTKDSLAFTTFVDKYFDRKYEGNELYSVRNSLLKEYTTRFKIKGGKDAELIYILGTHHHELHMKKVGNTKFLNLEDLALDVFNALESFYSELEEGKLPLFVTQRICEHHETHLLQSVDSS